ncbi:MAG: cysteine desulfurase [Deferribacteres bacterium]|nr:cysteine desulfurase [candidate division KSB1 bacterium]MCB9503965.1 cysteine desulfurase [Deferribacteres bacterium]
MDIEKFRKDFPILQQKVHGKPLVYLDNAATSQTPKIVIDAIQEYYLKYNSNVHRGVHRLSQLASEAYEETREIVQDFLNANSVQEVIFTKGTTDGINLLASSIGRGLIREGDEIIISAMEHHSNIVPWQIMCEDRGAKLRVIPINDDGEIIFEAFEGLLNERTKLVSIVHTSNSLGTVNPLREIIDLAHKKGVPVLVDGAQAVPHTKIDVQDLDCDFFVFSGHKVYGPTGVGVLYGKKAWLEKLPPYQGGGDMILNVTFEKTKFNELPYKFEAGTPNIADVIGLGVALNYVQKIGYDKISAWENELMWYARNRLQEIDGLRFIGNAKHRAGAISFVIENVHPHDIGTILDREGIAVRTGHHCTQPVMQRFKVPATTRASFAFYNTKEEIDQLINALHKVIEFFA